MLVKEILDVVGKSTLDYFVITNDLNKIQNGTELSVQNDVLEHLGGVGIPRGNGIFWSSKVLTQNAFDKSVSRLGQTVSCVAKRLEQSANSIP